MVDGASRFGAFLRVTLPLVAPGPRGDRHLRLHPGLERVHLRPRHHEPAGDQTMPVWLQAFNEGARGTDWGGVMAGSTLMALPGDHLLPDRPAQGDGRAHGRRGQGVAGDVARSSASTSAAPRPEPCASTATLHAGRDRRSAPTPRGADGDRRAPSPSSSREVGDGAGGRRRRHARAGRRGDAASSARPSTSASTAPAPIGALVGDLRRRAGARRERRQRRRARRVRPPRPGRRRRRWPTSTSAPASPPGSCSAAGCGAAPPAAPARSGTSRCGRTARRARAGRSAAPRRSARAGPSADDPSRRGDVVAAVAWAVQLCVMTLDVDVVAVGGGHDRVGRRSSPPLTPRSPAARRRRRCSPTSGWPRGCVSSPADVPLGSLGAVLAVTARSARRRDARRSAAARSSRRRRDPADGRRSTASGSPPSTDRRRRADIDAGGGWIVPGVHRPADQRRPRHRRHDAAGAHRRARRRPAALRRDGVPADGDHVPAAPRGAAALAAWPRPRRGAGAVPLGLHLEGPMLAPARPGAHPPAHLAAPIAELIDGWSADDRRRAGDARPGAARRARRRSPRSRRAAWSCRSATPTARPPSSPPAGPPAPRYVTHLFNAMRPFGHRDPGPIGAALADDGVVVGLICDGIHVDPVAVRDGLAGARPATG